MRCFDFIIPLKHGVVKEVEAYPTAAPGLFVYRSLKSRYEWDVANWQGFLVAGGFPSRSMALRHAETLSSAADWTQPQQFFTDDERAAIRRLCDEEIAV